MDAHIEIQGKKTKKAFLLTLADNDVCTSFILHENKRTNKHPEQETEQQEPKKQRTHISAEDVSNFSLEEQEHFSIDSLELWRQTASLAHSQTQSAGEQYLEHLRRAAVQMRVASSSSSSTTSPSAPSAESSLSAVAVHMQRAMVEATQLVQLSAMLKSAQFVGLRTSFQAICRERGPLLPPLQVVDLLQRRFHASGSGPLEDAIQDAEQAVSQRRRLCDGLLQLKRSWRLTFYDKRTRREVTARQFDPSKCSLAVNCPALPLPLPSGGGGGGGGGLVPLVVDAQGNFKVSAASAKMPQRTLQVSVCREDGQVVAEESLWALRGLLGPGPLHMDMDTPAVREVNEFCERRRHTLLSELLLQSLRGEVAQAAERWPVHSRGRRLPQPDHHHQQHQQQEESSTVEDVLLHDPVDAALSLLLLGDEGALEVAFTSSLKVRFVLQPIPAPQTEPAGQGDGQEQEAEEQQEGRRPWLQLAVRTCMLQMYSLLVAGAQSSEAAGKAARGKGPLPASHSSCSLVRAAMDVLRRRLYRYRAEQLSAVRDGEGFWAVTLSEKALAGAGRLALLADEFRFELRTPCGDLLTELSVCGQGKSFATVSFAYHSAMAGEVRVAPRWPRAAVSFDSFRQLQMFVRKCIAGARTRAKLHHALGHVSAVMIEQCSAALFRIVRLVSPSSSSSSGDFLVAAVTVLLDQQADGKGGPESGVRLRVEVHGPTQGLALGMVSQEVSLEDSDAILRTIATAAAAEEAMS